MSFKRELEKERERSTIENDRRNMRGKAARRELHPLDPTTGSFTRPTLEAEDNSTFSCRLLIGNQPALEYQDRSKPRMVKRDEQI